MIFNEIYSIYFLTCKKLIEKAQQGELNPKSMIDIIRENAYSESDITISDKIRDEKWQFIKYDGFTPIKHDPQRPLTQLELRFLKTISLDKRMVLFEDEHRLSEENFLKDVEPLFLPDSFNAFDRYLDGDDFKNPTYIENFRVIRKALRENKRILILYKGKYGNQMRITGKPISLEYSEKDDKFRVILSKSSGGDMLNMSRIVTVSMLSDDTKIVSGNLKKGYTLRNKCKCVFELEDERNALERAMLHFAHFKKEAVRVSGEKYRISLWYDYNDETELLIRILSFGPMIKLMEPESLVNKLRERLILQKKRIDAI